MDFPLTAGAPARQRSSCAVIPLFEGRRLTGTAREFDAAAGGLLARLIKAGDARTKLGSALLVPNPSGVAAERALLVGCGKASEFGAKQYRRALQAAATSLAAGQLKDAVSFLARDGVKDLSPYYATRIAVESFRGACYRFDELKSRADKKPRLNRVCIGLTSRKEVNAARPAVGHGQAIANGMALARDLGNRPANVCTPSHMARHARAIAKSCRNMEATVLTEREMKRYGMGALLSVTAGATEPARLIVLRYRGAPAKEPPIALVGKGVTFDTGGISLKPPPEMDEMKFDMCGAAGVLGTMRAVGEIQPKLNAVAVVPACENMPSGTATRPGDIIKTSSGKTVEILNTDAEGRLILSDALTYAERFKPRLVIDVATLTGACVVALGPHFTGLFTPDDTLAKDIAAAGERALDPVWRLPVTEDYAETLKSNFADFANVGSRWGGASIAAAFLGKFTTDVRWAHLDIAGTAWKQGKEKGATGRPVPLLTDLLLDIG